ncbi:hypothetical protein DFJ74DRAFT_710115 [Hyaloraphidium curvatum]|nr:hypothetical protein DFJ74DRAFT_710115 [Hyaloraphidium curvatum]
MELPKPAPFFAAETWLAAFPSPPPPSRALSGAPPPPDPAAALRTPPDPTGRAIAANLADVPLLRAQVSWRFLLGPLIGAQIILWTVYGALAGGAVATSLGSDRAASGPPELAGGFAAVLIMLVSAPLAHVAGYVSFWRANAGALGMSEVLRAMGYHWLFDAVWRVVFSLALFPALVWTPAVVLGSVWATWYGILLFTLASASWALLVSLIFAAFPADMFGSRIVGRARRRLLQEALKSFLSRVRRAVKDKVPFESPEELWDADDEPYVDVQAAVQASWAVDSMSSGFIPLALLLILLSYAVAAAVTLASGACVPAYVVLGGAYHFLMLVQDLWSVAVRNAEVAATAELCLEALQELRQLCVLASPPKAPADPIAGHLAAHAAAIEGFAAAAGRRRARFLGFVVEAGSVRAFLVTVATVAFAFAGFLRGFGARLAALSAMDGPPPYSRAPPTSAARTPSPGRAAAARPAVHPARARAKTAVQDAINADFNGEYERAQRLYKEALDGFAAEANAPETPGNVRAYLRGKIDEYSARAAKLSRFLDAERAAQAQGPDASFSVPPFAPATPVPAPAPAPVVAGGWGAEGLPDASLLSPKRETNGGMAPPPVPGVVVTAPPPMGSAVPTPPTALAPPMGPAPPTAGPTPRRTPFPAAPAPVPAFVPGPPAPVPEKAGTAFAPEIAAAPQVARRRKGSWIGFCCKLAFLVVLLWAALLGAMLLWPHQLQPYLVFLHWADFPPRFMLDMENPEDYLKLRYGTVLPVRIQSSDPDPPVVTSQYPPPGPPVSLQAWHFLPLASPPLLRPDGLSRDPAAFRAALGPASRAFLYLHGNAGNIGSPNRAATYALLRSADPGAHVLALEYRGFGASDRVQPTEDGLVRDAAAGYGYLLSLGVPPSQIVVVGHSLGSGVAARLCAEEAVPPPRGLVLLAPYTSVPDAALDYGTLPLLKAIKPLLSEQQREWVKEKVAVRFDTRSIIAGVADRVPVLAVHGARDGDVPAYHSLELFNATFLPSPGSSRDPEWEVDHLPGGRDRVLKTSTRRPGGGGMWLLEVGGARHGDLQGWEIVREVLAGWVGGLERGVMPAGGRAAAARREMEGRKTIEGGDGATEVEAPPPEPEPEATVVAEETRAPEVPVPEQQQEEEHAGQGEEPSPPEAEAPEPEPEPAPAEPVETGVPEVPVPEGEQVPEGGEGQEWEGEEMMEEFVPAREEL